MRVPDQPQHAGVRFEDFATARTPQLLRLAARLLGDPSEAEDVVQETWAVVYGRWNRISRMENPEAYATTVLVHRCRRFHRRARSRPRLVALEGAQDHLGSLRFAVDPWAQPTDAGFLWTYLRSLSRRRREVLVLRYFADLPEAAVAQILGIRPSTVRRHVMDGLGEMRRLLTPDLEVNRDR